MDDASLRARFEELRRAHPEAPIAQLRDFVLREALREYPRSFRSVLADGDAEPPQEAELRLRCHCGACAFAARMRGEAVRCHCPPCRRFHCSAFAALVEASAALRAPALRRCLGACEALGAVERLVCARCSSKLGVVAEGRLYAALGCVEDESLPEALARHWQGAFRSWEAAAAPAWWSARPSAVSARRAREATGGCACGACAFAAAIFPGEVQHCYCRLCRRLSGAAAMSWVPASKERFRWTASDGLQLVRTTGHGQRHMCATCGGVLTIVYDSQPDCIWPVAGALDDESVEDGEWYRVVHICCSMMQPWYRLPDDDLPRLRGPG